MNGARFPISRTINKHHFYKLNALMRSSKQGDIQTHKRQKHPVQNLKLCRDQTEEERSRCATKWRCAGPTQCPQSPLKFKKKNACCALFLEWYSPRQLVAVFGFKFGGTPHSRVLSPLPEKVVTAPTLKIRAIVPFLIDGMYI